MKMVARFGVGRHDPIASHRICRGERMRKSSPGQEVNRRVRSCRTAGLAMLLSCCFGALGGPVQANIWADIFGYDTYEDCLLGEAAKHANPSAFVLKTIREKCRGDFPLPKTASQWLPLAVTNYTCTVRSDPETCETIETTFRNDLDYGVGQFKAWVGSFRNDQCSTDKGVWGRIYFPPTQVYSGQFGSVVVSARIKDGGDQGKFCVLIYAKN